MRYFKNQFVLDTNVKFYCQKQMPNLTCFENVNNYIINNVYTFKLIVNATD